MEFLGKGQHFATETHEEILLEIELRVAIEEHAQTGQEEKCAEDVKDKMKPLDQRHAQPDHHAAHGERAENSPNQDSMLGTGRDTKIVKDEDENEDVVDAQRVLNDVACKKIEAVLGSS